MVPFQSNADMRRYVEDGWTTVRVDYKGLSATLEVDRKNYLEQIVEALASLGREYDTTLQIYKFCLCLSATERYEQLLKETV